MKRLWAAWAVLLGPALACGQPVGNVTSFDYQALELRRVHDHWHLSCGTTFIKDLGTSEADAREAVHLMRNFRLTQRCTIGKPQPVIEYWLADNNPPVGIIAPHRLCPIDVRSLRVETTLNQWCLYDARQLLFTFGPYKEEAEKTRALLQRYQFNRVLYVGAGTPVMMLFLSIPQSERGADHKPEPVIARPVVSLASFLQPRQLSSASMIAWDAITGSERIPLDWHQAQVRLEGNNWKLCHGTSCLIDFGVDGSAAREALRVFQYYRFTEQCRLGNPTRPVTLYLVDRQSPRGVCLGVRSTLFQPDKLVPRRHGDDWLLCEGERPILWAGTCAEEADQVLKAIQRYKLDTVLRVGKAELEGGIFLVKQR